MIHYLQGNLFDSKAECLVNAVNCEGVMGKGIAYQFKKRFPDNTKAYEEKCKKGELRIGKIHPYYNGKIWIVNFPTKDRWREPSRLSYIDIGLEQLVLFLSEKKIRKIAIPALGAGNGGLPWEAVRTLIEQKMSDVENLCDILVYEPTFSQRVYFPEHFSIKELILLQFKMYLRCFNMLRIQKGVFFLNNIIKRPLFKFDIWREGPYSVEAERCMNQIKQYQLSLGETDPKRVYDRIWLQIVSKKVERDLHELLPKIEKIACYINGIRSEKKLEGITGLLYVLQREKREGLEETMWIKAYRDRYPDRAKRFSRKYLIGCVDELMRLNMVEKNLFQHFSAKRDVLEIP